MQHQQQHWGEHKQVEGQRVYNLGLVMGQHVDII